MYTIYIYMCVDQAISSYNETVLLHLKDNKTSEKKYLRIDNDRDLKPLILAFFNLKLQNAMLDFKIGERTRCV